MESHGHPQHQFSVTNFFPGLNTSPDDLVIHFQHHLVDRHILLSADEAETYGTEEYGKLYQEPVFIPKNLVVSDLAAVCLIVSEHVSRIFDDIAHVSLDANNRRALIRKIMNSSWVAASHFRGMGVEVIVRTIRVHYVIVEFVGEGMVPADETAVKALLEEETAGVEGDGESCVICMEELPRGTQAVRMPCSHLFHGACIGRWLENSHYCPVCRYEMPPVIT